MARILLVYEGYSADLAHDGKTALGLLRENPPDPLILDLMLLGIDGLEVCRRLRADPENTVAALVLTARDATADRGRGLDVGAQDYPVKRCAYDELVRGKRVPTLGTLATCAWISRAGRSSAGRAPSS